LKCRRNSCAGILISVHDSTQPARLSRFTNCAAAGSWWRAWPGRPTRSSAAAQGDAAEQHDFRELRADGKPRVAQFRFALLDGGDPFLMLPVVVVVP